MKWISYQHRETKWILMFFVTIVLGLTGLHGQHSSSWNIGAGAGLSYGGFGGRLTYMPIKNLGLFGSLGYNLDAFGYNLGAQFHIPSKKKVSAYFTGMYGYNTVLIVEAIATKTKTTYYGFSTGIGVQFKLEEKSFLCAELLLPFRPQAYKNALDDLELLGYDIKDALPLAFAVGYHFRF